MAQSNPELRRQVDAEVSRLGSIFEERTGRTWTFEERAEMFVWIYDKMESAPQREADERQMEMLFPL